ncbi:MAG: cupin [Nocardioidaceae bacterium]|nr:cupin [Nocardioidaceae bacterium]
MDALRLLSGDAQTFIDKVWAARVHVHKASPSDLVSLLSLDDVDHLLTSTAMRTPSLRIAQNGNVLPSSQFTRSATLAGAPLTGLIDARKVLDLFESGATLVLQGLHRYWPPLTELVRSLELGLGHPCQANAYLTPPGSQGFALHSDTHDVFVLQTHGKKLWEVHHDAGEHSIMLEPGTSMYLPTGTPHAARTQDDASLHVTVGINQITWRQALDRITARTMAAASLDESLPAGYLDDPRDLADGLTSRLAELASAIASVDADAAAHSAANEFLTTRSSHLPGALRDRLVLHEIQDDTLLRRRSGSVCVTRQATDRLHVLLGDRELLVPSRLADPMEYVREHDALRPSDLAAWLDLESRLVLTRRLVREGLLQVQG